MTDLRDYQAQAIEQLEKATKALYVLPTGGGKSVIAIDVMMRSVQRGERALMLRIVGKSCAKPHSKYQSITD